MWSGAPSITVYILEILSNNFLRELACVCNMLAFPLLLVAISAPSLPSLAAVVGNNSAYNISCIVEHCTEPWAHCELDGLCRKMTGCVSDCGKDNNTQACTYGCINSYEDAKFNGFMQCALTEHGCLAITPPTDSVAQCRDPPTDPAFDADVLDGTWWIPVGESRVYDCYPCQYGAWSLAAPQQNVSFKFKVPEADGKTRFRFINETATRPNATRPGYLHLTTNSDGMQQVQKFWVLGTVQTAATPVIFVYWCATESKGYSNEGVNILTRTRYLPDEARPALAVLAARAGFDFGNFCEVDNLDCDVTDPRHDWPDDAQR